VSRVVAVVDDDPEILELLALVLGKAGYKAACYPSAGKFLDGILRSKPDLCLIDVNLPGMDGREVIRVLRANPETRGLPVVAISAAARSSADMVRGFDSGADEYLPKPLDLELLVARIGNLLARGRSAEPPPPAPVTWGPIAVYPAEHRVALSGKDVALTHLEFKLLVAFLEQPNRVLARSWLLQNIWDSPGVATRTVDKHVETLRKKLPPLGRRVEAVVGVGYLFRP